MAASLLLRQSNVKLQEELRKANNSYTEEKAALRSHLSGLRLDLSELHNDNRTITTDDTNSRIDTSMSSEHELRRLAEFDGDSGRSLQLPSIKNLNMSPGKKDIYSHHKKERRNESNTARSNKTLRFHGNENDGQSVRSNDGDNNSNNDKQESQKFLELQKNQEVLRNIGRANLKEKRQSLIRLPTISSAKKRNSLWDSGNNVSRPKGQSTSFEQNSKLYVEDSMILSKRAFKIPSIKDSQRSEIQLSGKTRRPLYGKRKVQFTRPRPAEETPREKDYPTNPLDVSTTEASSLNTTMADVSLEDNTLGNITFDEETFNKQLVAKHDQTSSSIKSYNNNKRLNQSSNSTSVLQPINESNLDATSDSNNNKNNTNTNTDADKKINNNKTKHETDQQLTLPPIKIKTLAKKNLMIHDMNNMRTSQTSFPKLRLSPENRSVKDSDRSVGTKLSKMSQETESWKSTYVQFTDPEKRNKTLTEIMFAVRSRMRDNEETLRFGEAPRRKDKTLSDLFLGNGRNITTPRWSDATHSPRKGKISRRARPTIPPTKAEKPLRRKDNTADLQGYLKRMCRQKRVVDPQQVVQDNSGGYASVSPRHHHNKTDYSNTTGPRHHRPAAMNFHKQQPRMIAQEA